jgi:outer membrane PBP1 activator LpoA protein
MVIGPLDKPSVALINALPQRPAPVLALNHLPAGVTANAGLYQFGLAVEDEAVTIARRAYEDRALRVALISSDADWSVRATEAFRSQFTALGGTTVGEAVVKDARSVTHVVGELLLVSASEERVDALTRTIGTRPEFVPRRRSDLDALIVLTDPAQARAVNAAMAYYFAADVAIYAMAQAAGAGSARELGELDGFRLPELQWRIFPSEIRTEIDASFPAARSTLAPLFALGVDAFQLSERPDLLLANSPARLTGATGTLQVLATGLVTREPAWAIVQHGALVALPSVAQ